jgi:hypothetical protein
VAAAAAAAPAAALLQGAAAPGRSEAAAAAAAAASSGEAGDYHVYQGQRLRCSLAAAAAPPSAAQAAAAAEAAQSRQQARAASSKLHKRVLQQPHRPNAPSQPAAAPAPQQLPGAPELQAQQQGRQVPYNLRETSPKKASQHTAVLGEPLWRWEMRFKSLQHQQGDVTACRYLVRQVRRLQTLEELQHCLTVFQSRLLPPVLAAMAAQTAALVQAQRAGQGQGQAHAAQQQAGQAQQQQQRLSPEAQQLLTELTIASTKMTRRCDLCQLANLAGAFSRCQHYPQPLFSRMQDSALAQLGLALGGQQRGRQAVQQRQQGEQQGEQQRQQGERQGQPRHGPGQGQGPGQGVQQQALLPGSASFFLSALARAQQHNVSFPISPALVEACADALRGGPGGAAAPGQLAAGLHALATLGHKPPRPHLEALLAAAQAALPASSHREVSTLLCAVAKLGHRPGAAWLSACALALCSRHEQLSPQSLCNGAWALATLQAQLPQAQLQLLLARAAALRQDADPKLLSNFIWAVAKLGARPCTTWLSQMTNTLTRRAPQLAPQTLVMVLWAFAAMGYRPKQKRLRLLTFGVQPRLGRFNAQDLATLLWAFGELQFLPNDAWLFDMFVAARKRFNELSPAGVAMALHGLALLERRYRWGARRRLGCERAARAARRVRPAPSYLGGAAGPAPAPAGPAGHDRPGQGGTAAGGGGERRTAAAPQRSCRAPATPAPAPSHLDPPQPPYCSYAMDTDWLDALLAAVQPRLADFPARHVAALLTALARSSYAPPGAFLAAALQRFAAALPQAEPQHLCNVAWALSAFWDRHADHQWLFRNVGCVDAAAAAALALLPGFNARDLEQLLLAFARLGYYPDQEWLEAHEARVLQLGEEQLGAASVCRLAGGYAQLSYEPAPAFVEAAGRARAALEAQHALEPAGGGEAQGGAAAAAGLTHPTSKPAAKQRADS